MKLDLIPIYKWNTEGEVWTHSLIQELLDENCECEYGRYTGPLFRISIKYKTHNVECIVLLQDEEEYDNIVSQMCLTKYEPLPDVLQLKDAVVKLLKKEYGDNYIEWRASPDLCLHKDDDIWDFST